MQQGLSPIVVRMPTENAVFKRKEPSQAEPRAARPNSAQPHEEDELVSIPQPSMACGLRGPAVAPFLEWHAGAGSSRAAALGPASSPRRPCTASPRMGKPITILMRVMTHPDHPHWHAAPRPSVRPRTAQHAARRSPRRWKQVALALAPNPKLVLLETNSRRQRGRRGGGKGAEPSLKPRAAQPPPLTEEEAAVVRLQAQTRGSVERKSYARMRKDAIEMRARMEAEAKAQLAEAKAQAEAAARLQSVHRGRRTRRRLWDGEDPKALVASIKLPAAAEAQVVAAEPVPAAAELPAPAVAAAVVAMAPAPVFASTVANGSGVGGGGSVGSVGGSGGGAPSTRKLGVFGGGQGALNDKLKWAIGTTKSEIATSRGSGLTGVVEAALLTYRAFEPAEPEDESPGEPGRAALSRREEMQVISHNLPRSIMISHELPRAPMSSHDLPHDLPGRLSRSCAPPSPSPTARCVRPLPRPPPRPPPRPHPSRAVDAAARRRQPRAAPRPSVAPSSDVPRSRRC